MQFTTKSWFIWPLLVVCCGRRCEKKSRPSYLLSQIFFRASKYDCREFFREKKITTVVLAVTVFFRDGRYDCRDFFSRQRPRPTSNGYFPFFPRENIWRQKTATTSSYQLHHKISRITKNMSSKKKLYLQMICKYNDKK